MIDVETFPIKTVGECKIASPLDKTSPFVTDASQILYEHDMADIRAGVEKDNKVYAFQKAGPREKIFFDPSWCKAAILTAGGICPGLNNVIKGLTETLKQVYGVPVSVSSKSPFFDRATVA